MSTKWVSSFIFRSILPVAVVCLAAAAVVSCGHKGGGVAPGAPAGSHAVSGAVTISSTGLSSVTLTLSPGGMTATTGADGSFSLASVANGTYTITPSKAGYRFSPEYLRVSVSSRDISGVSFTASLAGLAASGWPKFRGSAANTGLSPYVGTHKNALKWTSTPPDIYQYSRYSFQSPIVGGDGTIYCAATDGKFYALNPSNGSVRWSQSLGDKYLGIPTLGVDGVIYIGSEDKNVYALDAADGHSRWSFATDGKIQESAPAIGLDGTVFVGSQDGFLYALDPMTGALIWKLDTTYEVQSSPAIGRDGTVYCGGGGGFLYAVNPKDGGIEWKFYMGNWIYSAPAIASDGTIYLGCRNHKFFAVNPDGTQKWVYNGTQWFRSSPAIGPDGTVFVGCQDGYFYAFDRESGAVKWKVLLALEPSDFYPVSNDSSPAVGADGTIYVGGSDGKVYALNPLDGSVLWKYTTGTYYYSFGSPAIGPDGTVYAAARSLYAFGGSGLSTWFISGRFTFGSSDLNLNYVTLSLTPLGYYNPIYGGSEYREMIYGDGQYELSGVPDGTYTLTPRDASFRFVPPSRTITVSGGDASGQNFAAISIWPGLAASAWPKFHGDPMNSGQSPFVGAQTNHVKWTFSAGGPVRSSPSIGEDGTIYVGCDHGNVYALDGATATLKWQFTAGGAVASSPEVGEDGTVYASSVNGNLYALDPVGGSLKWTQPAGGISSPNLFTDGTIVAAGDRLSDIRPDGNIVWQYTGASFLTSDSSPAINWAEAVYLGDANGTLYAIWPWSGAEVWKVSLGGSPVSSPLFDGSWQYYSDGGETVYVGAGNDLLAVNSMDGTLRWKYTTGGAVRSCPATGPEWALLVGSDDGKLYAFQRLQGKLNWTFSTGGAVRSSPAVDADGTAYFGGNDNYVYALNPDGSLLWKYATGGTVTSSPAIAADGTVFIGSQDGNLYAFGP